MTTPDQPGSSDDPAYRPDPASQAPAVTPPFPAAPNPQQANPSVLMPHSGGPTQVPPQYPGAAQVPPPYPGAAQVLPQYPGAVQAPSQYPGAAHVAPQYPGAVPPPQPTWPGQGATQQFGAPPVAVPGSVPPAVPPKKKHTGLKVLASVLSMLLIACFVGLVKFGVGALLDLAKDEVTPAPSNPFEGTLAADFPEGEAGIVLPQASAVTGFTEQQVADALEKVRQGLIAARLDQRMLVDHDSSVLLNLLAPDAQDALKDDFAQGTFFSFASQIAPGYSLTEDKVRVKGTVEFKANTIDDIRVLEVITKFVWVYAFTGELKRPGDHLVVVRDEVHWVFPVDADVEKSSRGMWINEATGYASNIDCDLLDQGLLALGKPRTVVGAQPTEDEDAVFDPNGSLDLPTTC